jgi:hypothetical protein
MFCRLLDQNDTTSIVIAVELWIVPAAPSLCWHGLLYSLLTLLIPLKIKKKSYSQK